MIMIVEATPRPIKAKVVSERWQHVPERLDQAGATASLMCAVHCAVMPLVITFLPLVGLAFLSDPRLEWVLFAVSAAIGITSLRLGFLEHRSWRALAVLIIGLGTLATGRIAEACALGWWAVPLVVAGGLTVAFAHRVNRRLCQSCGSCGRGDDRSCLTVAATTQPHDH